MKHIATISVVLFAIFAVSASAQSSLSPTIHHGHDRGYSMRLGPNGEPHFSPAGRTAVNDGFPSAPLSPQAASPYWDSLFITGGYSKMLDRSFVHAIAIDGDDVYIGGSFEFIGSTRVYNVAHYDHLTKTWKPMGDGFDGTVNALAVKDGKVYAGGSFSYVGFNKSTPMNDIAVWDGNSWSEVGGGLDGSVYSIAFLGSNLVVGGYFSNTGYDDNTLAISVSNIAMWDGSTWSDMGSSLNDQVNCMLTVDDSLYVGGYFYDYASGLRGVAKYSGGDWIPVGVGVGGGVNALAVMNGNIWIGGDFLRSGDATQVLNMLAVWDGASINAVGTDPKIGITDAMGTVLSLHASGDSMYIGGMFSNIEGVQVDGIAKWRNGKIYPVSGGLYGTVNSIVYGGSHGTLVGGVFLEAGGQPCNGLASLLSGDVWTLNEATPAATGGYLETDVTAVVTNDRYVFVGGYFTTIATKPMQHIAMWDKVNRVWLPLGKGLNQGVRAMYLQDNKLYVGGGFNFAGDTVANHVAYYDLSTGIWHSMGNGSVRFVEAFAGDGTNIYASSIFDLLSLGYREEIAKWDGSSWTAIEGEINGRVYSLCYVGSTLFVGGYFNAINSTKIANIATYDGNSWSQVGGGTSSSVWCMLPVGNDLYVSGYFAVAGSDSVFYIARWDGQRWHSLGGGLGNGATSLAHNSSGLYVGGYFIHADGIVVDFLANWDGSSWAPVLGGTGSTVRALALDQSALYVGGSFTHVNNSMISYRFAILHFGSLGVPSDPLQASDNLCNYPNPFAAATKIEFTVEKASDIRIALFNVLGEQIREVVHQRYAPGTYSLDLDASSLPAGAYLCRYAADGVIQNRWMTVTK